MDSWELRYSPKFTKQCVLWRVTARYFSQNYSATRAPLRQRETSVARPYDTDPFYPLSSVHFLQTCLLKAQRLTRKQLWFSGRKANEDERRTKPKMSSIKQLGSLVNCAFLWIAKRTNELLATRTKSKTIKERPRFFTSVLRTSSFRLEILYKS